MGSTPLNLDTLESARKSTVKAIITVLIIAGLFAVAFAICFILYFLNITSNFAAFYFGCIFCVAFAIFLLVALAIALSFKKKRRSQILNLVVQSEYENFYYNPSRGVNLDNLLRPNFFAPPDRYLGSNALAAKHENILFEMCDYNLQKISRDNKGNTTYTTYASGRFVDIMFERDLKGEVKIIEKSFLNNIGGAGLKKVELESLEFNKKFNVKATNELVAFFVLTPQIQEKILQFEKKYSGRVYVAFMVNHLYIAIEGENISFNFSVFKPLDNRVVEAAKNDVCLPKIINKMFDLSGEKFGRDATIDI